VFDPIDRSLLSRRYTFCRYVDDIHIFCKTQEEAYTALFDIADILDKQQRLTLQRHKTEVLPAGEFRERATRITAEAPLDDFEKQIITVIDRHTRGNRYGKVKPAKLPKADLKILSQHNLEKVACAAFSTGGTELRAHPLAIQTSSTGWGSWCCADRHKQDKGIYTSSG